MSDAVRAHVIFKGRVQGVFFRAFAEENAIKLGIRGWVRNLPDGDVEAVFEGKREDVEKIIYLCRYKHPYARVDDVIVKYEEPKGEVDFRVRYS